MLNATKDETKPKNLPPTTISIFGKSNGDLSIYLFLGFHYGSFLMLMVVQNLKLCISHFTSFFVVSINGEPTP
jgi:hypothetical protein